MSKEYRNLGAKASAGGTGCCKVGELNKSCRSASVSMLADRNKFLCRGARLPAHTPKGSDFRQGDGRMGWMKQCSPEAVGARRSRRSLGSAARGVAARTMAARWL